jgi:mediator of RNA polymerase II transcription subunit 12
LLDLISVALQSIERHLTASEEDSVLPEGIAPPKPGSVLAVVVKLLKFTLGLPLVDSPSPVSPRPDFGRLAGSFLRVIVTISATASPASIQSMSDLLVYIVDSAPAISRGGIHSALMAELSSIQLSAAAKRHPALANALPYTSPPRRPMSLANSTLMGEGPDAHLSLDDRPWEMIEHLDPPSRKVAYGDRFLASKPLKDVASIPMALFGPKMKRDAIPGAQEVSEGLPDQEDGASEEDRPWEAYASERDLGDGQAGEPIAVRRLATSLYSAVDEAAQVEDDNATVHSAISPGSTIVGLPASPAVSTLSARPRRASTRNAVAPTNLGSNKNPIALDDDSDDDDESSDDSPEVVRPSAGKRPRTGGKSVAGKTTRKTTGGKSVARKGVGGKGMRGGKAPAKGRRKVD